VRTAALDVIGEMHSQLGPVLHAFIKSNAIQPSIMTLLEKAIYSRPYDHTAQSMERRLKCITLSVSTNSTSQPSSMSILSIPTTDLVASLSSDYLSRLNSTEGKTAWKIRRDALDEIKMNVGKCGGLIATNGSSFAALKQLFAALCSRLNDSQSNLKPMAATLIGAILSLVDDDSKAKLGRIVFAALLSGAMNDMKKTMRDAALSAIAMGTEQSKQNGGGTNILAVESLIVCFESSLSEAALKSSGLPDILSFLNDRLQSFYSIETTDKPNFISVHSQLAKVIVLSLISSKSEIRSASEKLLNTCATSGIVPMEDIDNEIRKLLPAQQRSVRSIIPKISTQDQELVDSFKQASARARTAPIRTTSSSQQPVRQTTAKCTSASSSVHNSLSSEKHNDINPLHSSTAKKSTKDQRLSLLSRGDHWPFYPEEPSGNVILQTVCKSWSQLISAQSIQVLFPNGGLRSHEDAVGGCELISRSINCSESFVNQLDLIFKWTSCALLSRDHTSGLRSLLSMLQLMFKRLLEISYVMQDSEAIILLPYIVEKASVAKSQFKDQFADVLSLIRNGLYPLQRYGSIICISVIAKSKSSPARSLAAIECTTCVKEVGTGALGRNGVEKIAKALSIEKLLDIRVVYLDLFDAVTTKSSLEKVIELCTGDGITDKAKEMIIDRCSKRPLTAPPPNHTKSKNEIDRNHLKTSIPTRKSLTRTSTDSLNAGMEKEHQFSSSSVVTGTLKSRLQRLRDETQKTEGSTSQPTPEPTELESLDVYTNSLDDVIAMINGDITIVTGLKAVQRLCLVAKNASDGPLSASQLESLRQDISSDLDRFVETFASALKCAFLYKAGTGVLPCPLIEEIVDALTYVFRTPEYSNAISQQAVECCIQEAVHALLDDRLDASKGAKADRTGIIVKAINKVSFHVIDLVIIINTVISIFYCNS
jgi:cytoskeleton-associated protein 5